jgi:hypothetical protein
MLWGARASKSPDTDAEERDANESLTVMGNRIERQHLAERDEEQADDEDPGRVTEAPREARPPGTTIHVQRERRDGGQVI